MSAARSIFKDLEAKKADYVQKIREGRESRESFRKWIFSKQKSVTNAEKNLKEGGEAYDTSKLMNLDDKQVPNQVAVKPVSKKRMPANEIANTSDVEDENISDEEKPLAIVENESNTLVEGNESEDSDSDEEYSDQGPASDEDSASQHESEHEEFETAIDTSTLVNEAQVLPDISQVQQVPLSAQNPG